MTSISNSRGVKSCVLISVQFFELFSKTITSFKINIIDSIYISKKIKVNSTKPKSESGTFPLKLIYTSWESSLPPQQILNLIYLKTHVSNFYSLKTYLSIVTLILKAKKYIL